jgi:hypothetical protein
MFYDNSELILLIYEQLIKNSELKYHKLPYL